LDLVEEAERGRAGDGLRHARRESHPEVIEKETGKTFDIADERDVTAEFGEGQVAQVDAIHGDDAGVGLAEAVEQVGKE
jgi:hypothetical protein